MHIASRRGNVVMVRLLLDREATIDAKTKVGHRFNICISRCTRERSDSVQMTLVASRMN